MGLSSHIFFSFYLLLLTGHTNGQGYSRDFMQICAGVPFNMSLEVLIVLHWSRRLLGNKRHKVVSQNCLLLMRVLVHLMTPESHILDIISACISGGEEGQRVEKGNGARSNLGSRNRRRYFLLFKHSCKFISGLLINREAQTHQSCRGASTRSHAKMVNYPNTHSDCALSPLWGV